ncbi:MAG: hemolysin family protein [Gemmatimonadaceae bacterium]|nr:hemolysin family protein [Gemmatimonadaceae bacterium]
MRTPRGRRGSRRPCAADGRLMALEESDARGDSRTATLLGRREPLHRALAALRLVLFAVAGAASPPVREAGAVHPLAAVGLLAGLVAVCEVLARAVAGANPGPAGAWLDRWTLVVGRVLRPVVGLGERTSAALSAWFPPPAPDDDDADAVAEQFLTDVAEEADVREEDRALLRGAFLLGDTAVQEIMTPRVEIVAVERGTPWSELIDKLRSSAHSRLPVYNGTIDDILGIVHLKDVLGDLLDDREPTDGWQTRVRPAYYIPPTKRLDALLREFRQQRLHLAIVLDEYGGTTGLVTIEDVLEEIVGEIEDEHDEEGEESDIEVRDGEEFWVSGRVTLDELSEALGVEVTSEEVTTVGGLIYERLGRVPRAGERLEIEGLQVVVERVRRRQVQRVYFRRPAPEAS